MSWLEHSIMAKRGVAGGKESMRARRSRSRQQGKFHYVYGPYAEPVLTVEPGAVVDAETHDAFEGKIKSRERQAVRNAQLPLPQPPDRADLRQGRQEGRLPRGLHPLDQAARTAAGRHHLPHPASSAVSSAPGHGAPQQAAAGKGEEDSRWTRTASTGATASRCPTSPSSARSAWRRRSRRSPRCSRTITAATWTCRTWRPAP